MKNEFKKSAAYSLLLGSILATITMVLHPTGGNLEHIVHFKKMLMQSHSMAIFCLPFICFGFFGISNVLQTKSKISILAFIISCFGLIAATLAATINGLVLPQFATDYSNTIIDKPTIKAIIDYGKFINISLASIFIVSVSISVVIWSFLIIRTSKLSKWLGYLGFIVIAFGVLAVLLNFNFTNVLGFRSFTFGLVLWKIAIGTNMIKKSNHSKKLK
jgi:uncharacterized membrane protein YcjF (UPF0283 family)